MTGSDDKITRQEFQKQLKAFSESISKQFDRNAKQQPLDKDEEMQMNQFRSYQDAKLKKLEQRNLELEKEIESLKKNTFLGAIESFQAETSALQVSAAAAAAAAPPVVGDSVVSFDVGGIIFKTNKSTIVDAFGGEHLLARLVKAKEDISLPVQLTKDDSIFLDQDPRIFNIILNILRNCGDASSVLDNQVFYGMDIRMLQQAIDAAHFFGLEQLAEHIRPYADWGKREKDQYEKRLKATNLPFTVRELIVSENGLQIEYRPFPKEKVYAFCLGKPLRLALAPTEAKSSRFQYNVFSFKSFFQYKFELGIGRVDKAADASWKDYSFHLQVHYSTSEVFHGSLSQSVSTPLISGKDQYITLWFNVENKNLYLMTKDMITLLFENIQLDPTYEWGMYVWLQDKNRIVLKPNEHVKTFEVARLKAEKEEEVQRILAEAAAAAEAAKQEHTIEDIKQTENSQQPKDQPETSARTAVTSIANAAPAVAQPATISRECGWCGGEERYIGEFKKCSFCKAVYYCCKDHQVWDWKSAHKHTCSRAFS